MIDKNKISKEKIVSEKMRTLLIQLAKWPRPRDLYDLWFILCHREEECKAGQLQDLITRKCRARRMEPDAGLLVSRTLEERNVKVWQSEMKSLVREGQAFEKVWEGWVRYRDALLRALELSSMVGIYAVVVDANDESAKKFYGHYGFVPLTALPLSLCLPIGTIARAYGS